MRISLIVFCIILVLYIFAMIRNTYTWHCRNISIDLVSKYKDYLIIKEEYDMNIHYSDEMIIEYNKHMFSIWLWGKYSCIKPQYKELLKNIEKI